KGMRSLLFGPLMRGETVLGGLWFASREPQAFAVADVESIRPLLDLLALALASALDVRDVVDQVSAIAREVLDHDRMSVGLLEPGGKSVRIFAYSGTRLADLPESIPIPEKELL